MELPTIEDFKQYIESTFEAFGNFDSFVKVNYPEKFVEDDHFFSKFF